MLYQIILEMFLETIYLRNMDNLYPKFPEKLPIQGGLSENIPEQQLLIFSGYFNTSKDWLEKYNFLIKDLPKSSWIQRFIKFYNLKKETHNFTSIDNMNAFIEVFKTCDLGVDRSFYDTKIKSLRLKNDDKF